VFVHKGDFNPSAIERKDRGLMGETLCGALSKCSFPPSFFSKDKGEGVPLEKNTLAYHQKGDITQKKFNNWKRYKKVTKHWALGYVL